MKRADRDPKHFLREETGASAVEFALIAPFIIFLLLASFDIARAIEVKSKITTFSRTISDFVTQGKTVTPTELSNILTASRSVLYPYSDSADVMTVTVESIRKQPDGAYKIDWSYPPANSQDRTTNIAPADDAVVRTDVTYRYKLRFAGFLVERFGWDEINLNATTYMASRWGMPVEADKF